ncbi:hypothetical protein [Thalassotalea sp. ND16A]|uniref:hypothetical protein n=1 Tax=Thalassotalea sp. ND16A TaxID=1535422 RepID=UPI00051A812F|nr:hypothetical protein [Thalassotalea sp. ND16A]KGJ98732.1 hypothetical protein ND16A_0535 [Thalassotalea sp. ND16A]
MSLNKKRASLIALSMVITLFLLRVYLHLFPDTNFDLGSYNIHHLFSGLLLITFAGIPLVIFSGNNRLLDITSIVFGIGLSMALDEWVYLIATDGSDNAYLLPISFWGAVLMIGLVLVYIWSIIFLWQKFTKNKRLK